jgi:hypothetical protein
MTDTRQTEQSMRELSGSIQRWSERDRAWARRQLLEAAEKFSSERLLLTRCSPTVHQEDRWRRRSNAVLKTSAMMARPSPTDAPAAAEMSWSRVISIRRTKCVVFRQRDR